MFESLYDSLPIYKFGIGRMTVSNDKIHAKSDALGDQELVDRCVVARDSLLGVRRLNFRYQNDKKEDKLTRREAVALDNDIDPTVGEVYRNIKGFAEMRGDSPHKVAANKILADLFPNGVAAYTTLEHEEQYTVVEELVTRLLTEYPDEIDLLGTRPHVENLAAFNTQFGRALNVDNEAKVTWTMVKEALFEAREDYAKVVLYIQGHFLDDAKTRLDLLAPVIEQNERVARYMKQRGSAPDVDPDTGEELDEDDDLLEPVDDDQPEPVGE